MHPAFLAQVNAALASLEKERDIAPDLDTTTIRYGRDLKITITDGVVAEAQIEDSRPKNPLSPTPVASKSASPVKTDPGKFSYGKQNK